MIMYTITNLLLLNVSVISMEVLRPKLRLTDSLVKHLPLQAMIDLSVFTGYNNTFTNQRTNSFHIDEGGKTNQLSFDDLRFSNTTGILQKKKLCGLLVLN